MTSISSSNSSEELKDILVTALSLIVKGSSRRQSELIKSAKEALAAVKEYQTSQEEVFIYPAGQKVSDEQEASSSSSVASSAKEKSSSPAKESNGTPQGVTLTLEAEGDNVKACIKVSNGEDGKKEEEHAEAEAKPEAKPEAPVEVEFPEYRNAIVVIANAMKVRQNKVVSSMLDVIYMLISKGFVRGNVKSLDDINKSKGANPVALLLEATAGAHEYGDENMERKILKIWIAMVLAESTGIHGEALLLIVKTCYHIFLGSRSESIQLFAKASLTQILIAVMTRMEHPAESITCIAVSDIVGSKPTQSKGPDPEKVVQELLNLVFQDISEIKGLQKAESFVIRSDDEEQNGVDADTEVLNSQTARSIGTFAMEGEELTNKVLTIRKDTFLVFRALCKLSMKTSEDNASDQLAIRGKILSLELIKVLLQNSGKIFQTHERFIEAVKQYLCLSLLKNCASIISPTFQLSASIFQTLTEKFRSSMKSQFGVFFPMIYLKPLESPTFETGKGMISSYDLYSQWVVLFRCLYSICCDKQILSDIFVNYDCDIDESNIYERLIAGLVRVIQRGIPMEDSGFSSTMLFNLNFFALQCLVGIVKSLAIDDTEASRLSASGDSVDSNENEESTNDAEHMNGDDEKLDEEVDSSQMDQLEQKKAYKMNYQKGLNQFKKKPKKGIQFLQKHKMLGESAEEVAKFLKSSQGLDKSGIGEYLGDGDPFNLDVMYSYVEMCDFTGMKFDEGLRHFLSGFRLPGEAQKIDRFMLKYAERYCICNPENIFANTDAAYVFAYSVIMLQTDAHNAQVKNKMTMEEFKKNNRGINDEKDLPGEFLSEIYENVVNNEFKIKGDDSNNTSVEVQTKSRSGLPGLDAILNVFGGSQVRSIEPNEEMIRQKHEEMKQKGSASKWATAVGNEDTRPMLEVAWAPFLGAISIAFEESDDESITSLCMDAFYYVIKVAAPQEMETVRDAFLTSLAKATHLHMPIGKMHQKRASNTTGLPLKTLEERRVRNIPNLKSDDLRHPLDRQNTQLLSLLPGIEGVVRAMLSPMSEEVAALENIGTSVLVGEEQLPDIYKLLCDAASLLQVEVPELYIRQDPVPNAYTLAITGRKPFIVMHTSLIDTLSPAEVQCVLAHELGHLKCNHGLWLTTANLLALGAISLLPMISSTIQESFLRWLRSAELTCDRAALVVVQDHKIVISTLMKLAGGSPTLSQRLNVDAFIKQAKSYDEATSSPLGWYIRNAQVSQLTHPLPVMRAREIEQWSRSPDYKKLLKRGRQYGSRDEESLDF